MEIVYLKIENFRGIKNFESVFNKQLICFVGRGDSGKSTILDAISYVLCGAINVDMRDSDFYNCDTSSKICIELSLKDFPKEMLSDNKWGLYVRGFKDNKIIDDITTLGEENSEKIITIKFEVDNSLEAKWFLKGKPNLEDKQLSWVDREKIKVFKISDYNDKHFSWVKGSPLYKCLKENDVEVIREDLIKAYGRIKEWVKEIQITNMEDVKENICKKSKELGLSISEMNTSIDSNNLFIKEGYFCFHDNNIPIKQKGKGTKRLLSIAIQLLLLQTGGIVLIDEIEQGLEPDRIKNLVGTLKKNINGQLFITTHSPSVIEELSYDDIYLVNKEELNTTLTTFTPKKQRIIRKFPEVWYAKKVILCEGKTEVGFCRAINTLMESQGKNNFSVYDTVCISAGGDSKIFDDANDILEAGLDLLILCDNDLQEHEKEKEKRVQLEGKGAKVVTCDENYCFEKQIIYDAKKAVVEEIFKYIAHLDKKYENEEVLWKVIIKGREITKDFSNQDAKDALADYLSSNSNQADKPNRIKSIEYGEKIGDIISTNLNSFENSTTKRNIDEIIKWIEK